MSDDLYYKVGVTLHDDFFLSTGSTVTGTTGQSANFTMLLAKDGTGNQATTGITITEVSAVNNPGLYHITASGTSSFVASTGEYSLKITWASDTSYQWDKTFRISTNGSPTGTTGAASFTAIASDGRVVDSGLSPLENATIYIQTPSTAPYTELTTDATGVWGPVGFPSDGTWPGYVQLAGYAVYPFDIIVSGSTVTGPGADLQLTAISAASGLTLSSLKTYARFQVRGNVGSAADSMITSAINAGLSELARAHKGSWLRADGDITFQAPYSTGTITLTNGDATVTLDSGVWPSWATSGKLLYSGQAFRVSSRTSDTVIELTTAWAGSTVAGASYVMYQNEYTLPSDCMVFSRVRPGTGWGWGPGLVSFDTVRDYENSNNFQSPNPGFHAIQNDKLLVWPAPSVSRNWTCTYYRKPATLVNNNDEADWDPMQLDVLHRAIDVQLAIRFGPIMHGDIATCQASYRMALNEAINTLKEKGPREPMGRRGGRQTVADMRLPDAT